MMSDRVTAVFFEDGADGLEEVEVSKLIIGNAAGPVGFETEMFLFLEPVGDLFDGGLLQIVRQADGLRAEGEGSGSWFRRRRQHLPALAEPDRGPAPEPPRRLPVPRPCAGHL